ncbi:hypothetical protein P5673_015006 [Acropora cervicornis]|uniref:Uncharacterized protein n=1 Tax=Acropora cervicornis TaxID=6130 RepID=A0AAD9QI90_ACRCE|nr:hypothetical protein P5673_015006 [Acropora cervicornis]
MSIIGKRFEDTALKDLCIESGVIAEGSILNVLTGKMCNRGLRVHKCMYDALMRLAWKQFALYEGSSFWPSPDRPDYRGDDQQGHKNNWRSYHVDMT